MHARCLLLVTVGLLSACASSPPRLLIVPAPVAAATPAVERANKTVALRFAQAVSHLESEVRPQLMVVATPVTAESAYWSKGSQPKLPVALRVEPRVVTPRAVPVVMQATPVSTKPPITRLDLYFEFDRSDLVSTQATRLLMLVDASAMRAEGAQVLLVGHTDARGAADYNDLLSARRAEAVKRLLVAQGIPASRIQAMGKGEAEPAAENTTETGRALNRRVVISLGDPR